MLKRYTHWPVLLLSLLLFLTGCNGHKSGSSASAPETLPGTETVYGVAATGAAVQGTVTLKSLGEPAAPELSTHTDTGDFNFNVTGQKGPFLLRVVSDNGQTQLLSFVHKRRGDTRANINPLTNLITLYAGIGSDTQMQDPAYLYANAQSLAALSEGSLVTAREVVMAQRSAQFQELLAEQGLDVLKIDPIRDAFEIGKGLDTALDGVSFRYNPLTGEAVELEAQSGAPINGGVLSQLRQELKSVHITDVPEVMGQETTTRLRLLTIWQDGSIKPVSDGVIWRVSDPNLASIDAKGDLTVHTVPNVQMTDVLVTADYVVGGKHHSEEATITVSPWTVLKQVKMRIEGSPGLITPRADGAIELDARALFELKAEAVWHDGSITRLEWGRLMVQDGESSVNGVYSLMNIGWPGNILSTGNPSSETELTLRGEVQIRGETRIVTQRLVLKPFVRKAASMVVDCDASAILPGEEATCVTRLQFNDGGQEDVAGVLSLSDAEQAYAAVVGNKVLSKWADSNSWSVTVKASYGQFSATKSITLMANGNRVVSLDLTGVAELAEGATANVRAWANWSDGTRTDVTSWASWRLNSTDYATLGYGGQINAGYILNGSSDQVLTVGASICPQPNSWGCSQLKAVSASADITLAYRQPMLVGVSITAPAFVSENSSASLTADAVWNKKTPNGLPATSAIGAAAAWHVESVAASVQGNTLMIGSEPTEPLIWLSASYTDPNDAQVTRSAQTVVTIRKSPQLAQMVLGGESLIDADGLLYSLVGGGWSAPDEYQKVVRQRYLSAIKQETRGGYYLREDGSVWRGQDARYITDAVLSAKLREVIVSDAQLPDYVPRRLGSAPASVALAYLDGYNSPAWQDRLYGVAQDGRVWYLNTSDPTVISYENTVTDVDKIVGNGQAIIALTKTGTAWVAGRNACGALAQGHYDDVRSNFVQAKNSSGALTGIVDVTISGAGTALALDNQGYLWVWGCNSSGSLGLNDLSNRAYATRNESVSGFVAPLPSSSSIYSGDASKIFALRQVDGSMSVWGWGGGILSPQLVMGSENAAASGGGGYVVKADGSLHKVLAPTSGELQWRLQALWTRTADGSRQPLVVNR